MEGERWRGRDGERERRREGEKERGREGEKERRREGEKERRMEEQETRIDLQLSSLNARDNLSLLADCNERHREEEKCPTATDKLFMRVNTLFLAPPARTEKNPDVRLEGHV